MDANQLAPGLERDLLDKIIQSSPVPTFVIDLEHRVTHWNRACEVALHYPAADMIGSRDQWRPFYPQSRPVMADLVVSGDIESVTKLYLGKFRHSTLIPGTYEAEDFFPHIGPNGIWLYFTAAPLLDSTGELIGAIETLQDITLRKHADEARHRIEGRLASLLDEQRLIFDNAHVGIALLRNRIIVNCNRRVAELFGFDGPEQLIGQSTEVIFPSHEDWLAEGEAAYGELVERGYCAREMRHRRRNGEIIWCATSGRPLDPAAPMEGSIWVYADISERKRHEAELQLADTVFANTLEALLITDRNGVIVRVNQAFTDITGYAPDEVIGHTPRIMKSGHHDDRFYQEMWRTVLSAGSWEGEVWDRRKNGEVYPKWLSITTTLDAQGDVQNFVGCFSDISLRKATEERIHHLAHHDPLTGLPNRLLLRDRFNQISERQKRSGTRMAFVFLDLDHFKRINDSLGHPVGDGLLIAVVARLKMCLRDSDTLSRQGGDEFIILLDDADGPEAVARIADKMQESLLHPFDIGTHSLTTSASMGIALSPDDGRDFDTLMQKADTAMYHAKEAGRQTFSFFSPEMNQRANLRLDLTNRLRRSIAKGELSLVFQPQVYADSRHIFGAEALLRWYCADGSSVSPAEFIPVAEESGLILPIGEWVLSEACRQARLWKDGGNDWKIAVNVSAKQIFRADVVELVRRHTRDAGISPQQIEIELTESTLMEDSDSLREVIADLKTIGSSVAIDDFGTGYSSLSYLKRFRVDKLKIDRSFIADMQQDSEGDALARAVIGIARSLRLRAIAEGVETIEQLELVQRNGCNEIQGYFFSRPLSAEVFEEFAKGRRAH